MYMCSDRLRCAHGWSGFTAQEPLSQIIPNILHSWIAGSHTVEHPSKLPVGDLSRSLSNLSLLTLASQLDSIYQDESSFSQYG